MENVEELLLGHKNFILASAKINQSNIEEIRNILANPPDDEIIFGDDDYFLGVVKEAFSPLDYPVEGFIGDWLVRFRNGHVCVMTETKYKETIKTLGEPLTDAINLKVTFE